MRTKAVAGLVGLLLAISVAPAAAETGYATYATLTINGRGRAHGVGLCMTSVMNMARAGSSYARILPYFYRGTRVLYKRNLPRTIRVGVYKRNGTISVGVAGGSYFTVRTTTGRLIWRGSRSRTVSVSYSARTRRHYATLRSGGRVIARRTLTTPVRVYAGRGTVLRVLNDRRMYRGHLELRWGVGSRVMWAVNIVAIEYYLRGLGEEPESWPFEGLKTLAVVSRGYAAYRALHPRHTSDGFAVCNTGDCQAYVGYNYERVAPNLRRAVYLTRNRVVTYRGSLAITPYFSNSGGQTENIEYVWNTSPKPWLRSVKTSYASGHAAYSWRVPLSFNSLTQRLARSSATKAPGSLTGFRILSTGVSPRVRTMRVVGSSGYKTVTGEQFRSVASLQSTWFRFDMPPRLTSVAMSPWSTFCPDGDGVLDTGRVYFTIDQTANVRHQVYDSDGDLIDTSPTVARAAGRHYLIWDGKNSSGSYVPDGRYRIIVTATDAAGNKNYAGVWATTATLLGFVSGQPETIIPNGGGSDSSLMISYRLARTASVNVHIDTEAGTLVKTLASGSQSAGTRQALWDGTNASGARVAPGTYQWTVTATDGTFSATRRGTVTVAESAPNLPALGSTPTTGSRITVKGIMDKLPGWLLPGGLGITG